MSKASEWIYNFRKGSPTFPYFPESADEMTLNDGSIVGWDGREYYEVKTNKD